MFFPLRYIDGRLTNLGISAAKWAKDQTWEEAVRLIYDYE